MLKSYIVRDNILEKHSSENEQIPKNAVWIDLIEPTLYEEKEVEKFIGVQIPTREEMREIELSNRLYEEDKALYMTATILAKADTDAPENHAVTFILTDQKLITIRYVDPLPFKIFTTRMQKVNVHAYRGEALMTGLLEAFINRVADILENIGRNVDISSVKIFKSEEMKGSAKSGKTNFQAILQEIGLNGDLISKTQESLISLLRLVGFLSQHLAEASCIDVIKRLELVRKDATALRDHSSYLASKITFLLDATLGMINIQQNDIMKLFSIAAVCLMPATVITGFYGMNFKHMPQLDWDYGYEFSIFLIITSLLFSFFYFRRKGWI